MKRILELKALHDGSPTVHGPYATHYNPACALCVMIATAEKAIRGRQIVVEVYRDEVCDDGCIHSGPLHVQFTVSNISEIKAELERRFNSRFHACADGKDGMYENSKGYGKCLVSNIKGNVRR